MMTDKQKKLVEDNIKFVYWFMRTRHLDFEEWIGDLSEQMCIAAIQYDETKGVTFLAYVTRVFENKITYVNAMKNTMKRRGDKYLVSLEEETNFGHGDMETTLADVIDSGIDVESDAIDNFIVKKLCSKLSERDKEILLMRMDGCTLNFIGKKYGISRARVDQILKDMGRLFRRM